MVGVTILLTGFLTCLALIIAVGPQSAWLIRQGLRRDRIALAVAVSWCGDLLLILVGTAGVSVLLAGAPWLLEVVRWVGAAYLVWFGARAFRSAMRPQEIEVVDVAGDTSDEQLLATGSIPVAPPGHSASGVPSTAAGSAAGSTHTTTTAPAPARTRAGAPLSSAASVAAMGLSVSVLNPHSWVDTLVVLGGMANSFGEGRWLFAAGAVIASLVFFLALTYGAAFLSRWLHSPTVWRAIDVLVGVTVFVVAGFLAIHGV